MACLRYSVTYISKILGVAALLIMGSAVARGQGAQISVAAAADLTFALNEIAKEYESQTHNKVKIVYGSSGNFFPQIWSTRVSCRLLVLSNRERYTGMPSERSHCGVPPI